MTTLWQGMIQEMVGVGLYKASELARILMVSSDTIYRIRSGATKAPHYSLGSRILYLYYATKYPDLYTKHLKTRDK